MWSVKRAILLLAGRGLRMGSLTENGPKCLLEVGGVSILKRALRALQGCGISEAILVVGHRHEQIERTIGAQHGGISIEYVVNSRYYETNTAYSLWLAKDYLVSNCLLLEGDVVFERASLESVLSCFNGKSVWAAVTVAPGRDEGVLLQRDRDGCVAEVQLVRRSQDRPAPLTHKCAGIQALTAPMACNLAAHLDREISRNQVHMYADLILSRAMTKSSIELCSLEGHRWAEVDDLEDLQRARQLFAVVGEPRAEAVLGGR